MGNQTNFDLETAVRECLIICHEIAIRIDLINDALVGKLSIGEQYAVEFGYLQLRYICELLSLGCLYLHGDLEVARKKRVRKQWNAEQLIGMLLSQYPHAFPQQVDRNKVGDQHNFRANSNPNALTK